jgi:hypothetical protein
VLYYFLPLVLRYPFGLIRVVSGELGFLGYVFLLLLALQVLFDLVVYVGA